MNPHLNPDPALNLLPNLNRRLGLNLSSARRAQDHPFQSLPTSVKKWRSTADSSGGGWGTQPDTTRRKVWQAGGSRSGDVGFGGGEMALEALEKPPFSAIFQYFSYSFHRVFRRPCPKARKLGRIQPRKALVLSHVPLRSCPLRSLAGYHPLPIQGGGQPGPRADNRESGQSEAGSSVALACQ